MDISLYKKFKSLLDFPLNNDLDRISIEAIFTNFDHLDIFLRFTDAAKMHSKEGKQILWKILDKNISLQKIYSSEKVLIMFY